MRDGRSSLAKVAPLLGLLVCCATVTDDGKAWGTAQRIDDRESSFNPRVAAQASGDVLLVWSGENPPEETVWAKHYTLGSGWGTAQRMDEDEDLAYKPEVATDGHGNAVTVWSQGAVGARRTIWSKRYTADRGWDAAVRLDTDATGDALDPQVAMDPDGNAVVVWHQSDGIRENVWATRSTPGDGWGTPELIELDNAGHAGDPQVAIDPDGNAIAVWHQSKGTRFEIWSNRFTPGGGWNFARPIESNDAGSAWLPEVAMDPNGNAVAVWHQSDGSRFDIWSNRFTPGGGWGTPERIEANDEGDADNAEVGMDGNGNAVAVWEQFDGIAVDIWSNRYMPGDGWGAAERIETDYEGDAFSPCVAVNANGDAVAVWLQSDGVRLGVWSNAYKPSKGWGSAEQIDLDKEDQVDARRAHVAMDPNGNAVAVWEFARQIWSNRFE